jgi:vacuolar-type H+-ATPase subunit I/STV1
MGKKKYVVIIIISSVLTVLMLAFGIIGQFTLSYIEDSISILNSNLAVNQDNLKDTETKLNLATFNLETKEEQLDQTQTELAATEDELVKTYNDLTDTEQQLESTTAELEEENITLTELRGIVDPLQADYDNTIDRYDNTLVNIDNLENSYGYGLDDPSYQMVLDFIAADNTDQETYGDLATYEQARDLKANAAKQGIRCAVVYIYTPDSGMCCVAFNTTDRGVIYIEPSTDTKSAPEVGKHYWPTVEYAGPWFTHYTMPMDWDDTVVKIWEMW